MKNTVDTSDAAVEALLVNINLKVPKLAEDLVHNTISAMLDERKEWRELLRIILYQKLTEENHERYLVLHYKLIGEPEEVVEPDGD